MKTRLRSRLTTARIRSRFGPRVELLEDRTVLSTLTVLNSADHGAGSLRQALIDAHDTDTISFAPNVHKIVLTSGELDIGKNVSIMGPGANRLTVSGNDAGRVLHIEGGVTVDVSGLTISHGKVGSSDGGAVPGGGGIRNEVGGTLKLDSVTVENNQAVGVVGLDEFGGGLCNLGDAEITSCSFSNNQVLGAGSFTAIGGSAGGAIENYSGASLTATNTCFTNNRAVSAAGAGYFGLGGALENDAGVNGFDPGAVGGTAVLTGCVFQNNVCTGGAGVTGNGGAINNVVGSMTLTDCVITGNRSVAGDGGQGIGGGILNGLATMEIVGCTITNNQAVGGNNATITADNPHAGGSFGGGIDNNFLGVLHISNSILAGNLSQGGSTSVGPGSNGVGGAISNSPLATLTVTDSTITGNQAIAGQGGPGVNDVPAGIGSGGGIDTSIVSTATVTDCVISGNRAVGGAGGDGNPGGDGLGGGLSVGLNALVGSLNPGFPEGSHLTVVNTLLINNQAIGGAGGRGARGGDGLGGGIFLFSRPISVVTPMPEAAVDLTGSLITGNSATGGSKGHAGGTAGHGIGGGVYNERGMLTDDPSTIISGNNASTDHKDVFSI
jgi:hypothetical protein